MTVLPQRLSWYYVLIWNVFCRVRPVQRILMFTILETFRTSSLLCLSLFCSLSIEIYPKLNNSSFHFHWIHKCSLANQCWIDHYSFSLNSCSSFVFFFPKMLWNHIKEMGIVKKSLFSPHHHSHSQPFRQSPSNDQFLWDFYWYERMKAPLTVSFGDQFPETSTPTNGWTQPHGKVVLPHHRKERYFTNSTKFSCTQECLNMLISLFSTFCFSSPV